MLIYLVRHGEAVSAEIDPARPLTERGKREVEETGLGIMGWGDKIDEIWHSTKLRAKQTAEILARVLNVSTVIEKEGLKPDDPVAPMAELLRKSQITILLAGHLPFLEDIALLFGKAGKFKTGGVVRIKF